ncbi:MAG: hypothetical protein ACJASX_004104 [Limisphaerales bacterium]
MNPTHCHCQISGDQEFVFHFTDITLWGERLSVVTIPFPQSPRTCVEPPLLNAGAESRPIRMSDTVGQKRIAKSTSRKARAIDSQ